MTMENQYFAISSCHVEHVETKHEVLRIII